MNESDVLNWINNALKEEIKVLSLGYISRYFYEYHHNDNNFYMTGSMGSALSFGIGVAKGTNKSVNIVMGEGSLLMNLSSLNLLRMVKGINLFLIDNSVHNSTGGQKSEFDNIYCKEFFENIFDECFFDVNLSNFDANTESNKNRFFYFKVNPLDIIPKRIDLEPYDIKNKFITEVLNSECK